MARRNQSFATGLGTLAQFESRWVREAQQEIRDKFLGMAKHLRGRPHTCRSPFDEAGGARQTPGWAVVVAGRACLGAARERGEPMLARTREEIAAYCDALKAAMLHGYEPSDVSAEVAILDFAREHSEAAVATTRFTVQRDAVSRADMMRELSDVIPAAARVLSLGSRMALPNHPLPLGAVR
jgi:hypothetical protein